MAVPFTSYTFNIGGPFDCNPHNIQNLFDSKEDYIVGCIGGGGVRFVTLSLNPNLQSVDTIAQILGANNLFVTVGDYGTVLNSEHPNYSILPIFKFTKTAGVINYTGPFMLPNMHGPGNFARPTCKKGTPYCFVGVVSDGS